MSANNLFCSNCPCNKCGRCCCQGPRGIPGPMGAMGPQGTQGPQGVPGQRGEAGASDTITVRNTTTGEAGTPAQVIDIAGSPNHILDFVIPQGATGERGERGEQGERGITGETGAQGAVGPQGERGEQGEQGERGEQGEQGERGEADRINVVETITGEAGTAASVEDDFAMGVHNLTFTIPKGEDAPTNQLAVAQLYSTTTQTLSTVGQIVEFDINQNFRNALTTQRTIQVLNAGAHKIEFGFTFSALTNAELTLYINELEMANTRLSFSDASKHNSGVFLVMLNANDELTMRVRQLSGDAILQDEVLNGYLIVTPAE